MATITLEERVATLENKVDSLIQKEQKTEAEPKSQSWLDRWFGAFDNNSHYDSAMALGEKYRFTPSVIRVCRPASS